MIYYWEMWVRGVDMMMIAIRLVNIDLYIFSFTAYLLLQFEIPSAECCVLVVYVLPHFISLFT